MRTDRKKDLDMYYNDHLKTRIISRLLKIKTFSEIMGIQSYIFEALDREEKSDRKDQVEFQEWKNSKE